MTYSKLKAEIFKLSTLTKLTKETKKTSKSSLKTDGVVSDELGYFNSLESL